MTTFLFFVALPVAFSGGLGVGYWICHRWLRPEWSRKAITDWYPSAEMVEKMWPTEQELDMLAARRALHDSGRLHPARSDASQAARVYRARVRGKRSTL